MNTNIEIVRKVIAKLKEQDFQMVISVIKKNLNKPDKVFEYLTSYAKRNKLDKRDKVFLLKALKKESIDLKARPWPKIISDFDVFFQA